MDLSIAFLRGINVGGHRVAKDDLAEVFRAVGAENPAPFLASGNVVFGHSEPTGDELRLRIERALEEALGYEVPTFLRSGDQLRSVSAANPFPASAVEASRGATQVAFLRREPPPGDIETVLNLPGPDDLLAFGGAQLFWLPSGGISESDLPLAQIERALGPMTIRTANTVARLVAKFLPEGPG